jgi:hypothetical protein
MVAAVRLTFAAALIVVPLWFALTASAHACSCAQASAQESVAATDLIVLATVREIAAVDPNAVAPGTFARTEVQWTIDVQEYLKGAGPYAIGARTTTYVGRSQSGDVQIHAGTDPACGFAPEVGVLYLFFFARRDDGLLTTSGCGINYPFTADNQSYATDLLAQVRAVLAGQPGLPNNGAGPPGEGSSSPLVPLLATGASLLASGAFLVATRRPR